VWARAYSLWAEIGEALLRDEFPLSGQAAAEERRRRAKDRGRREAERRLRMAGPSPAVPEPEPVTGAEKEHMAELLLTLAEGLGRLQEWSITLEILQEAEWAAVKERLRTGPHNPQTPD
jgi:hypothetical protein